MKLEAFESHECPLNCLRTGLCVLRISLLLPFVLHFVHPCVSASLVLCLFSALKAGLRHIVLTKSRNRGIGNSHDEQYRLEFPPKHVFVPVGILDL